MKGVQVFCVYMRTRLKVIYCCCVIQKMHRLNNKIQKWLNTKLWTSVSESLICCEWSHVHYHCKYPTFMNILNRLGLQTYFAFSPTTYIPEIYALLNNWQVYNFLKHESNNYFVSLSEQCLSCLLKVKSMLIQNANKR